MTGRDCAAALPAAAGRAAFYEELLAAFERRVGGDQGHVHVLSGNGNGRLRELVRSKLELKVGPHLDRLQQLKVRI